MGIFKRILHNEDLRQLIIYVLIGVLGLGVDFGIFALLTHFKMQVEVANFISSSCGLINNFFWNSFLNFKVHDKLLIRFVSYYLVGQITSLFIFVTQLGYNQLIVKAVSTFIATLIQFVINKLLTFRKIKTTKSKVDVRK